MGKFAGDNHIDKSIAVHISEGDIFSGRRLVSGCQGGQLPNVRICTAPGNSNVTDGFTVVDCIRLMYGNDVFIPVLVQIRHGQSVAATQIRHTHTRIIDDVFLP